MKKKIVLLLLVTLAAVNVNGAGRDTYTVVVSLDGLRWDYAEAFDVPFFDQLAREGVKAVMMPSFPSKTFPNHYTLATGLYPDHHGIVANTFKVRRNGKVFSLGNNEMRNDPQYFGGDPIWLTAKRQGVTTATVYWVGSDVPIKGEYATYWHHYQQNRLTFPQRVDEVLRLLELPEQERPHLIMAYFEEPDASGHNHGPMSARTRRAMEQMDSTLQVMWSRIQQLPIAADVNLIVLGDHGMTWVDPERMIYPHEYLKPEWVERITNDFPALVYANRHDYVDSICNALKGVDHLRVWKRQDVPEYLHYGSNPNVGDVVVLPDVGWVFDNRKWKPGGTHGYDHTASDMLVAFRAVGPDFKRGYVKEAKFRNVDIYPLLAYLLGVKPADNDGDITEVMDMLKLP
jgi:predicted AlkP superfamily pyrophosphatase or phosphodiesterase